MCNVTLTFKKVFGSPEKLYFLSYDIFICTRRYVIRVGRQQSLNSNQG